MFLLEEVPYKLRVFWNQTFGARQDKKIPLVLAELMVSGRTINWHLRAEQPGPNRVSDSVIL